MRALVTAVLLLGLGSAAYADIRDDPPFTRRPQPSAPPSSKVPRPTAPPPVEAPRPTDPGPARPDPPDVDPTLERRGCAAREMTVEWLFGLGALALGLRGLRRHSRRGDAARAAAAG